MRKTEKKQDPREPREEEKLEHEKTHLPFRSWCRHCVMGTRKGRSVQRREEEA